MCPEIPFWFVLLATVGAVSIASLVLYAVAYATCRFMARDRYITHAGQIKRRLFR